MIFVVIKLLFHGLLGMWEKLDKINNPELKIKAARFQKLFNAAYADGTLLKYKAAWHRWVEWTQNYSEIVHCPADPFSVCLF